MNRKLLAPFALKWDPFSPEIPTEALHATAKYESFLWRMENLAREGGFALVTSQGPGYGKSGSLRLVSDRLTALRDVHVRELTRPQAQIADFYRELGDLFGIQLSPHNRWAGAKVLRERWQAHIEAALYRPVLLIDEAQEAQATVLNELRHLCSAQLDSRLLLTVVLAGDARLTEKLRTPDLVPLGSRIRVRLVLDSATPEELGDCLRHVMTAAGNPRLMTPELVTTLSEHAAGNLRILMGLAQDLLAEAARRSLPVIDEKLYFELFAPPAPATGRGKGGGQGKPR